MDQQPEHVKVLPEDDFNRTLVENAHPPDWVNPISEGRYNLVILGAGTAGLVTAAIAAGLQARVALVEKHLLGGDCLNVGCVPSKGMIRAARAWANVKRAPEFGVDLPRDVHCNFGAAMARMRRLRAQISPNDSAHRFRSLGVDVFLGHGHFTGDDTVEVGGQTLRFARAVICTGARATAPPIPGLSDTGYLTNETVFSLTDLPPRLAVIGAGPIGCELAQSFARFGSQVTVFEMAGQVLPREDPDAAQTVRAQMERDGVRFVVNASVVRVERRAGDKVLIWEKPHEKAETTVDEILIGVGRAPNVEGLGLDRVGVAYDRQTGVKVDARLQTTNRRIFAAGDICFAHKFTHVADALAQIVVQNALFPHPLGLGYARTDSPLIPWCTYTDPEIAHVGLYEAEARSRGIPVESFTVPMAEVDRAILDGEEGGFARVHVRTGTDQILGATIVSAHAGDLINEFTVLMRTGKGLRTLAGTIHPYPTQGEVVKKVATAWRKTTLTERKKRLLEKLFRWMRSGG